MASGCAEMAAADTALPPLPLARFKVCRARFALALQPRPLSRSMPARLTPLSPAPVPPADWHAAGLEERLALLRPELIQLRRHLHRHPELSGQEQHTAALVAGELRQIGRAHV